MLTALLLSATLLGTAVKAQTTCSATKLCPESAPCCSEFGFCGSGPTFCFGGCNPLASNTLDSCAPNPVCKDGTYSFSDLSRVLQDPNEWNGNVTQYDWIVDKGNVSSSDNSVAMILTESNGGTRISSTRYVHYGTITAKLKTGRWNGVVTAFITMSNIKDEIDWEWPGSNTSQAQSNMFWQGVIPDSTYGDKHSVNGDTYSDYHTYTIDWQPDTLTFSIDGNSVRTLKKSDTMVNGVANYPQTPSRIQLSLWPAGISGEPQGTVDWAGGMIDWTNADYTSAGHFYALVQQVQVKCGTADSLKNDTTSYVYGANVTTDEPAVDLSNASLSAAVSDLRGVKVSVGGALALAGALVLGAFVL